MHPIFNKNLHLHIKVKDKHHPINIGLVLVVILASVITWFLTEYVVYALNQINFDTPLVINKIRPTAQAQSAVLNVGSNQQYKTIQSAVNAASPGDIIKIHPGTYHEAIIIPKNKNGITIEAYDTKNPPEIDGADQSFVNSQHSWTNVQGKIYKTSYQWNKAQLTDEEFTTYTGGTSRAPLQVYEDDHLLRGYRNRNDPDYTLWVGGAYRTFSELDPANDNGQLPPTYMKKDIRIPGRFLYDEAKGEIYIWGELGDNPRNHKYYIPVIFHLIQINAPNITLRNLVIKHSSGFAVVLDNADNTKIENNFFINNHYAILVSTGTDGAKVRNNFIQEKGFANRYWYDDCKKTVLWGGSVSINRGNSNIDVGNNTIYGTYMSIKNVGVDVKIHDNILAHSLSTHITATEYDSTVVPFNVEIYHNILHHVDDNSIGVSLKEGGPVWVYRNVFYAIKAMNKDGGGTLIESLGKDYFYHNTVVLTSLISHNPYAYPPMKSTYYRNNIFQMRFINYERYWVYDRKDPTLGWSFFPFVNGPDSDYNLFTHDHPEYNAIATFRTTSGGKYYTQGEFNLMKSETGLDPHSVEADPKFVNSNELKNAKVFELKYDNFSDMSYKDVINQGYNSLYNQHFPTLFSFFNVQPDSPAINEGTVLPASWPDIVTVTDGKPDIGAVEYGGVNNPPATQTCSNGTSYNQCVSNSSMFCNSSGKLIDNCEACPHCGVNLVCNSITKKCEPIPTETCEEATFACCSKCAPGAAKTTYNLSCPGQFCCTSCAPDSAPSFLKVGSYKIKVIAKDSKGNPAEDTITINVKAQGSVIATIDNPKDNDNFFTDQTINFFAEASGGTAPYTYFWTSDKQGEFSKNLTEDKFNISNWQTGTYTIIFKATDSKGKYDTDSKTITINPAVVLTCGDSICSANETCSSCLADCGTCSIDTIPPQINSFSVTLGSAIISWDVSDTGGSYLDRIEVWRASNAADICDDNTKANCNWQRQDSLTQNIASQNKDTHSGSATDNPSAGTYWYGIHVLDQAGNMSVEPNPPGPKKIIINNLSTGKIYYVKNGGNDSASGLSDAQAWATVAKVNNFAETGNGFNDGDIIQFKRGSTWTNDETIGWDGSIIIWGTINGLTIQDYGTGAKPRFNCNTQQAIAIRSSTITNLTIKNLDVSGLGWTYGESSSIGNVRVYGVNGVTIDGIFANGHQNTTVYRPKVGIQLSKIEGDIEIMNCEIYNFIGPSGLRYWGEENPPDLDCIFIFDNYTGAPKTSGTINIHDNILHDVEADGIQLGGMYTTTNIYNNTIYNFGENAIDLKTTHNTTIYNNNFYRGAYGLGGTGGGTGTIAMHAWTDRWNGANCENIVIRDNFIHDSAYIGIRLLGYEIKNIKIYRNRFENNAQSIAISSTENCEVYDNVIIGGSSTGYNSIVRVWNTTNPGLQIYNNSIYASSPNALYGIYYQTYSGSTGAVIKDNIIELNSSSNSSYPLYVDAAANTPTVNFNCFYNGNEDNRIYWGSTIYHANDRANWISDGHGADIYFSDPGYSNPPSDLSISGSSPCKSAGVSVLPSP